MGSDGEVSWHMQDLFGLGLCLLHVMALSPAGDVPSLGSEVAEDDAPFLGWTDAELGAHIQHFTERVRHAVHDPTLRHVQPQRLCIL